MSSLAPRPSVVSTLSGYVHAEGYARTLPGLGRRETWEETVARCEAMHRERFDDRLPPEAREELAWAFSLVRARRVLPAMRSLQYAGEAAARHPARLYNTWAAHCSEPAMFARSLYLLMCGGGIGFSVQRQHVARLPPVSPDRGPTLATLVVDDSIEGWARAFDALVHGLFHGFTVELDLAAVRPRGSPLRTAGGVAPGPEPLRVLEDRARRLFDGARGRRLLPVECYDLLCHVAEAALAGGGGRAAMLCVFSPDDQAMLEAKAGDWHRTAPWRRLSNNSALFLRGRQERADFDRLFDRTRQWGEPGVYFVDDPAVCSNSCVEVGFHPELTVDADTLEAVRRAHPGARPGQVLGGYQGATLSEVNGAALRDTADLVACARAAAVLNTLQAAYTELGPVLGPVARLLCERDALLGVGITGMLAGAGVALDPQAQRRAAAEVVRTNARWAAHLGIRRAARATLVKPAGKTSLVLGGVSNGIHPYHAERYFLRLRARPGSTAFEALARANPHLCHDDGAARHAEFPLQAPPGATVRRHLGAAEHLALVRQTLEHWVEPGTVAWSPARHNVSNTITVREGEWEEVKELLWRHRGRHPGVALLADTGELQHPGAPLRAVATPEDEARWQRLVALHAPVDFSAPA